MFGADNDSGSDDEPCSLTVNSEQARVGDDDLDSAIRGVHDTGIYADECFPLASPVAKCSVPEVTLCKVCAPIFGERSYERWSKFWLIWERIRNRHPWLPPAEPRPPYPGRHHQSLLSMRDSAQQGCYICSQLREDESNGLLDSFPLGYILSISATGTYSLRIGKTSFFIQPVSPAPTHIQRIADVSRSRAWTGDRDAIRLATCWVRDCLENHESCIKSSSQGTWRPSRLLDVHEDEIKLVSGTSEAVQRAPYVTLSHCWGTGGFAVLTTANISRYLQGVHINEFEATFREAFRVVRELSLHYIWIDCYCILQGSDDEAVADWKYESLLMGKVYAHGLLNIGALDSIGPAGGLFGTRSLRAVHYELPWSPTLQDGHRKFRIGQMHESIGVLTHFKELEGSRLMKRGWVVQESVLASRMLSFGKSGLFWQCSQLAACEAHPEGVQVNLDQGLDGTLFTFWLLATAARDRTTFGVKGRWAGALEAYGRAHLTYPGKDLLVALDGIGAELSKDHGGLFKYGMWDSTLPEALLFDTYDRDRPHTRNRAWPTWHWSSCYPKASHVPLLNIYYGAGHTTTIIRMAYVFMSDNCETLPSDCTRDFWPNMLLVGRLMTKPAWTIERSYDTQEDEDASSTRALFYLVIIEERVTLIRGHPWPLEEIRRDRFNKNLNGIILARSDSGAYRRLGSWVIVRMEDKEAYDEFYGRVLKTPPRLVVLE